MWKDEKAAPLFPHCPHHFGCGVRHSLSPAHGAHHHQFLYDPERDHRQLRPGLRHGQAGHQLHRRYHQFEVHPRQGELLAVYHRAVPKPGLSSEILEFGNFGGTHRHFAVNHRLHCRLRIHPLAGQGQRCDLLFLRHPDAHALPGDAGTQLSGERLAGDPQYPLGNYPAGRLRTVLCVSAHQIYAAHSQFPH